MKKKKKDLKARGIDESEEGDGKLSVEARGESSSSGSGELCVDSNSTFLV